MYHYKACKMAHSNYKGLGLLSIPSKVYTRILDSQVKRKTESKLMEVS